MPNLLQYRQYVAKELGPFLASTAASGTTTTLVDTTWPIKSSISQDDYWQDAYLLRPNAALATDKVRLVQAYTPSTGTLTVDTAWTNVPAANEAYELHSVMEPLTAMTDVINEALKRTLVRTEIIGQTVSQATRHSLVGIAPWLQDPVWVRQVGWLATGEDRNKIDPYWRTVRGIAVEDETYSSPGVAIQHPGFSWTGSEILYIRVVKQAYDHCRQLNNSAPISITGATNASPIQITVPSHGYATGNTVVISGVAGNTAANGAFIITVVDPNNFTLGNSYGNGAYTGGGTAQSFTSFGDQSGLSADSDEAPVDTEWLGAAALVETWRRYSQVLETSSRERQVPNLQDAAARFTYLTHQNFVPWPATFVPRGFGGPRQTRATFGGFLGY